MSEVYSGHICRLVHDAILVTLHRADFDKLLSDIEAERSRSKRLAEALKMISEDYFRPISSREVYQIHTSIALEALREYEKNQ